MPEVAIAHPGRAGRSRRGLTLHRVRARARAVGTVAWVLLAIALAVRVAVVAATFNGPVTLDPADFSRTAASIAQGHGYPDSNRAPGGGPSAFRPPGYPLVLAAVYAIAGSEAPAIGRLVGAGLGTVVVALIGLIALRLWGKRVSLIALGIAALAPPLVVLSTALISEALFVPLVLAAVVVALEGRGRSHRGRWALLTGVLVGAAALTRTNGALLVIPFALAFVPAPPRRRLRAWVPALAVVVAAAATVAPWTARNWAVFHTFVPVSDESGYTLAGTYDRASMADRQEPAVWVEAEHGASPEYARILRVAKRERWNEVRYGNRLQSQALSELTSHPTYALKVAYWNTRRMLNLGQTRTDVHNLRDTDIPLGLALAVINTAPLLLVLALGGALTRAARRAPLWLWLVPLCLATSVFVTGFVRFRAPIDPFLVMLMAITVADAVGQFSALAASVRRARASGSQPGAGVGRDN